MSTGDQSEYMRGKMAERGTSQGVQFSRDGFDRWAESTAPARAGQMEKMPAETQMARTGGAMSVAQAKRLAEKYGQPVTDMVVHHKGGAMRGGRSFLGVEIPPIVEQVIDYGEKVLNFALLVNDKLPEIIEGIQDEIIDNDQDPAITEYDRTVARKLIPVLNDAKTGLNMLKNVKMYADQIKNALGSVGIGGSRCGGATGKTAGQKFADAVEYLRKRYEQVRSIFDFITKNGKFLRQMLKLRALRPIGQQILDKIEPILAIVGAGKGGRRKATCECSDEEYRSPPTKPKRGGFSFPGFGQQKQEATMGDYGMMGGPGPQGMMYSGMKGQPMDDGGMQMDSYDMSTGKYESTYEPPPLTQEPMENPDKKKLMKQLQELGRQISESDSDEERERLKKRYVSLERKIKEMTRGGKTTFKPTTSSSKPLEFRGGMEKMESVNYGRNMDKDDELLKLKREFVEKARNASPAERLKLKEEFRKLADEIRMRGGSFLGRVRNRAAKAADAAYSAVTSRPVGGRKPSARGAIVKKVMREKGLTLPQASKYVKENGLY